VDGQIIALPGLSNAGKSTLTVRLLARGANYLTDEALAIGVKDLTAFPFHKALCLESGTQRLFPKLEPERPTSVQHKSWDVDPRTIGTAALAGAGPIGAIVFPTYKTGQKEPIFTKMSPVDVVRRLLENSFDFSHLGQAAFSVLTRLATSVPAYELIHGGKGEVELIEQLAESLNMPDSLLFAEPEVPEESVRFDVIIGAPDGPPSEGNL